MQLDWPINPGLAPNQFRALFTQCLKCHACLPRQNENLHDCDNISAAATPAVDLDKDRESLLHGRDGLPVDRFAALFVYCASCDKFMTQNASCIHDCIAMKQLFEGTWE